MKSWNDINVSKKNMTDNLKISFFNQDYQNIQIYICEFIVNKQSDLLITFPELALTGYPPEDLLYQPDWPNKIKESLNKIQEILPNVTVY